MISAELNNPLSPHAGRGLGRGASGRPTLSLTLSRQRERG